MYPSDYGLSAIETNWTISLYADSSTGFEYESISSTSWMHNTMTKQQFLVGLFHLHQISLNMLLYGIIIVIFLATTMLVTIMEQFIQFCI